MLKTRLAKALCSFAAVLLMAVPAVSPAMAAVTGNIADDPVYSSVEEQKYKGFTNETKRTKTINYVKKEILSSYERPSKVPNYYITTDPSKNNQMCGPIAAVIMYGTYQPNCVELMWGKSCGLYLNGKYYYYPIDAMIEDHIGREAEEMKTDAEGTTYDNWRYGVERHMRHVPNPEKNFVWQNMAMRHPVTNEYKHNWVCEMILNYDRLITYFLTSYAYCEMGKETFGAGYDKFEYRYASKGGHIVTAYGYENVRYTLADGTTQDKVYMKVCFGDSTYGRLLLDDCVFPIVEANRFDYWPTEVGDYWPPDF